MSINKLNLNSFELIFSIYYSFYNLRLLMFIIHLSRMHKFDFCLIKYKICFHEKYNSIHKEKVFLFKEFLANCKKILKKILLTGKVFRSNYLIIAL